MCMTEYIKERMQAMERDALKEIEILDDLSSLVTTYQTAAENLPRAGALVALLLGMRAEIVGRKATCQRVIADANAIQRETKEVAA
jgi:hypothetical protein